MGAGRTYRLARIESLQSVARHADAEESEAMQDQLTQLHALCARFKEQVSSFPISLNLPRSDHECWGDHRPVASTLLSDPAVRQELLSELEISKRLARLLEGLRRSSTKMARRSSKGIAGSATRF